MKKLIPFAGILVSLFFLYLTFHNVNFGLMRMHLGHLTIQAISGALICNLLFFVIRALYQINNLHYLKAGISFKSSLSAIVTAQFYNNLLPARIGEVVRSIGLNRREGLATTTVLSYIFVEKIIDMVLMLLVLIVILTTGFKTAGITKVMSVSATGIVFIICTLIVYARFNSWILNRLIIIIPMQLRPFAIRLNNEFISGLQCFRSVRQITIATGLLLASWLMILGVFYFITLPYLPLLELPRYACLFFMVFSIFSMSIPSAPAGIGVVHYGLFMAIGLLNSSIISTKLDLVAAFVIIVHLTSYVLDMLISGGLLLFTRTTRTPEAIPKIKSAEA